MEKLMQLAAQHASKKGRAAKRGRRTVALHARKPSKRKPPRTLPLHAGHTIDRDQELTSAVRQAADVFNVALRNAVACGLQVDQIVGNDGTGEVTTEPAKAVRIDEIRRSYK